MTIKEVNYNLKNIQSEKSVKLNKEKQKLRIRSLIIAHYFYKTSMYIYIHIYALKHVPD